VGSGNIGGANVWRSCGFGPFLVAVSLDIAKGAAMPLVARYVAGIDDPISVVLVGAAAIVGHTWPVFLGFKGGKAVATSGGVLLAIVPLVMLCGMVAWAITFAIGRMASLSSLVAAVVAAVTVGVLVALGQAALVYALFTWSATILVFWLHRSNIERIVSGTERRFQRQR
jgi:glycerol-3-phosphate acyltransferase PlsY